MHDSNDFSNDLDGDQREYTREQYYDYWQQQLDDGHWVDDVAGSFALTLHRINDEYDRRERERAIAERILRP